MTRRYRRTPYRPIVASNDPQAWLPSSSRHHQDGKTGPGDVCALRMVSGVRHNPAVSADLNGLHTVRPQTLTRIIDQVFGLLPAHRVNVLRRTATVSWIWAVVVNPATHRRCR